MACMRCECTCKDRTPAAVSCTKLLLKTLPHETAAAARFKHIEKASAERNVSRSMATRRAKRGGRAQHPRKDASAWPAQIALQRGKLPHQHLFRRAFRHGSGHPQAHSDHAVRASS
eukprot:15370-Rhodomonas_salina.8